MPFRFAIDRGGTFTDVYAEWDDPTSPTGTSHLVLKLLSVDPANYADAPREGIRRVLAHVKGQPDFALNTAVPSHDIESVRMGTTVATNALLERQGERMALVTTRGLLDLLEIGNQSRPSIFDLEIVRPELLYARVVQVDERVLVTRVMDAELAGGGGDACEGGGDGAPAAAAAGAGVERVVVGETGERVRVLRGVDVDEVRVQLQEVLDAGITSLAVALMHSYTFREHEQVIGELAREMGFQHVSLSSEVMPMVKIVPRAFTSCADAYLTPCIKTYLTQFVSGFDEHFTDNVKLSFMQSDGGLSPMDEFSGYRAILSGPAGGVVGYAATAYDPEQQDERDMVNGKPAAVIGFDMGGTSTDVSRYDGQYEHVFESTTAGVTIQVPQLDINTVAAGGGSRLFFRAGMFVVGPESAGAHPGPACYRKGGPLTVTDANLLLGRIHVESFPHIFGPDQDQPLDVDASLRAFEELTAEVNAFYASNKARQPMTPHEVAFGFLQVANEAMCRPIRALTQAKGYSISDHTLACFGGAGPQHACAIARSLGMRSIHVHRFSGILSAYGIYLADVVSEEQSPCGAQPLNDETLRALEERLVELRHKAKEALRAQNFADDRITSRDFLNLRYAGTDTALMISRCDPRGELLPGEPSYLELFERHYQREFGFTLDRDVLVDDVRVRATGHSRRTDKGNSRAPQAGDGPVQPCGSQVAYFDGESRPDTQLFQLADLHIGAEVPGPAMILDATSTIVVEPHCTAFVTPTGDIRIRVGDSERERVGVELDPIQLSIFSHRFMSIAEQMGRTLQRTSISTNIKERLDFSCALFGPDGGLVANAPHLPVHLGAMQEAVRFQIQHLDGDWQDGDVLVSNHPAAGGSHLPDITVITPVFAPSSDQPVFFVASRGHHGDIGGISPGSMPPFSKHLYQEGAAIVSFKLVRGGHFDEEGITELLNAPAHVETAPHEPRCSGTRNLRDNLSDLRAQVAANNKGIGLVGQLIDEYSLEVVQAYMTHIQTSAELAVRDMLREISESRGLADVDTLSAEDFMDDGSPIRLSVTIDRRSGNGATAEFDFAGTGAQVFGNTNAPAAITYSAIIYCMRCLVKQSIPLNQGCLNPITVHIPEGSLLKPSRDAAVVGGNVLTSQRITDVVFRAFRACAASQGCMNNFTFGNDEFGYYETIAGGHGAGPSWHGKSGVHTHMTNTRITDPEVLERRYPVHLRRFCLRPGTGGAGRFRGGHGVVREVEFLVPLTVGILSERRVFRPYGLEGGEPGAVGRNHIIRASDGVKINLGPRNTYNAQPGDRIVIETPGGGGYGSPDDNPDDDDAAAASSARLPTVALKTGGSLGKYSLSQESA